MKKLFLLNLLIIISICSYSQSPTVGVIKPGDNYTNDHTFKLYYMPETKVIKFLDLKTKSEMDSIRILKYKELTANYTERIYLADSTITLKTMEADLWHSKLLANDNELLEQKKLTIQLTDDKDKLRRSRIYFFIAGVVATSIVHISVK